MSPTDRFPSAPALDSHQAADFRTALRENLGRVRDAVPFVRALGFQITDIDETRVFGVLPYRDDLVGDPATGVIASGVITTILDSLCGIACGVRLNALMGVATLDLRIDYMRAATPRHDIFVEAECYHATRSVCFTRGVAHQGERSTLVASAAGAFAITGTGGARSAGAVS